MFEKLGLPPFVEEARKTGRAHPFFVEILLFLAVYWCANLLSGLFLVPVLMIRLFFAPQYAGWLESGLSMEEMMEKAQEITQTLNDEDPVVFIASLFASIGIALVVMLYCRFLEKRRLPSLGLRRDSARMILPAALAGLAAAFAAVLFAVLFRSMTFDGVDGTFSPGYAVLLFFGLLVSAFATELLMHSYLMTSLSRALPLGFSLIASAIFPAVLDFGLTGNAWIGAINVFLLGILTGLLMIRTGSVWVSTVFRALWTFAAYTLIGIEGMPTRVPTHLLSFSLPATGDLVSGGTSGIEAGIAGTLVLLLGTVLLLMCRTASDRTAPPESAPEER